VRESAAGLRQSLARLRELPGLVERVARRIEAENLTVNLQHRGLEHIDDAINSASNRLTLAIIIAALLVGSSLIITTRIEPHLFGHPALGIIGYLLSAVLGLWVVIDILRHGRHR
jgi:ubiquinone biosynthesis protein